MTEKVVLAFSGGLDTSVCVKLLEEKYDVEVITAVEVYAPEGFPRQNYRPHERKDDDAKAGAVNKTGECRVSFSGACGSHTQQGAIAKQDYFGLNGKLLKLILYLMKERLL